jgi:hypothetical protein
VEGCLDQGARDQYGEHGNDLPGGFRRSSPPGRPVGVKSLHLVADPEGLVEGVAPACHPQANFVRLPPVEGDILPVKRIDADEFRADLVITDTREFQALQDNVSREPRPGDGTGSAVADLPLPNLTVQAADADFEGVRPRAAPAATDGYGIFS